MHGVLTFLHGRAQMLTLKQLKMQDTAISFFVQEALRVRIQALIPYIPMPKQLDLM